MDLIHEEEQSEMNLEWNFCKNKLYHLITNNFNFYF